MKFTAWNVTRLLLGPAVGLALVATVQVDSVAAEPTTAADTTAPAADAPAPTIEDAEPVMIRSATTCGTNYPVCGNDALCPPAYPTCIDAAGGCYCHGSGKPPRDRKPVPL